METYKIKSGDTLKTIAKQYGTSVSKLASANKIQDPNMIKAGSTIEIPNKSSVIGDIARTVFAPALSGSLTKLYQPNNTIRTEDGLNLGAIPETVTPTREEVTVLSTKDNRDGTTTNFLSDGTTSTIRYNQNTDGSLQPYEVTPGAIPDGWDATTYANFKKANPALEPTQEDTARMLGISNGDASNTKSILDESTKLQNEITTLEESIANKSNVRQSAYEEAGIFDDVKRLNELKDTLKINLETREKLRGRGATSTEFTQTASPTLEKAYIESAALSNILSVNIAAIDQKIDDKYESDVFLIENKTKRLDNIIKSYSDIMTENQKVALEEAKQRNAIELKNLDFTNDLMKSAKDEALKKGANPNDVISAVSSGDLAKVYSLGGNTNTKIEETVGLVNLTENMLKNEKGLEGSAGVKQLLGGTALSPNSQKFRTDAKQLASKATLDYYTKLKANGAVFGTMTESEWALLSNASDAASLGINPETGKSSLSDKELKTRLQDYANAQMKLATADAMTKLGINPQILKDKSYLEIRENYYKRYVSEASNQANKQQDFTQTDTGFIQKEEGFSPTAYQDQAGVWTIGYGTTKINGQPVKPNDTITEAEAKRVALEQAVNDYSTFADKIGDIALTPNQFTALNSFEYNLGSGVWEQPTGQQILVAIQNGDFDTAGNLMQKFTNVRNPKTGQLEKNNGLVARRQREAQLLTS